jgi:membrane dipeptidase
VPFLSAEGQKEDQRLRDSEGFKTLAAKNATELFLRQGEYLQEKAEPLPIEVVVQHIEHVVEVAGIEHVGIGSDFDGILRTPQGLEDASCYGNLVEKLLERGFGEEDVLKICGGNMERVFDAVTGPGTRAHTARLVAYE